MTSVPPSGSGGWAAPPVPTAGAWTRSAVPPTVFATSAPRSATRGTWRRAAGLICSIVLVLLCLFLAVMAIAVHSGLSDFPVAVRYWAGIGGLVVMCSTVMLVWRHRWPVPIALGLLSLTLIVPTTPLPLLIALAAATAVLTGRRRLLLIVGAYLATGLSLVWDVLARSSFLAAFVGLPAVGSPERMSLFWAVPVLAAILCVPFAAYGWARGLRAERDAARQGTAAAERGVAALHREVELERHRQEIARELHDTLAARLSTLSLHAGALELTVGAADERTADAARAVRESAQHSIDDLRHVVKALRNPEAMAGASTGLGELPALIDEALRAGTDVRAQVLVTDPTSCDRQVAHAAYRLVQESISNVRRHAPGAALFVDVRGGPETGLTVRASNWLPREAPPPARARGGGGNGLTGMAERASLVGGTFQAGPTAEGAFVVVAWLPWAAAAA